MLRRALVLGLLVVGCWRSGACQFVHTQGKMVVDGSGKRLELRGTNLGNWLVQEGYMFRLEGGPQSAREIEALANELLGPEKAAEFWRQYRESYVTQADIEGIRRSGMNVVRVPMHYKYFVAGNDEGFRLLDRLVRWARAAGIYLILDMHCAPGGQTGTNIDDSWGYPWLFESEEAQRQTVEVWKRIAAHYKDEPVVLGYDLLNEPIPHYPQLARLNPYLEPVYKKITAGVREVDRHHMIILGGAQWDTNFKVFGAPFDSNVMYQFHKYWMEPVQGAVQEYMDFRERYNVPVYMGESGENTDEWIGRFVKLLEVNEIPWTFWPYKKMEVTSAVRTFDKPEYWDEIVEYAKRNMTTGDAQKSLAVRPSAEHVQAAFADLLVKIRFENTHVNPGYLQALGMKQ